MGIGAEPVSPSDAKRTPPGGIPGAHRAASVPVRREPAACFPETKPIYDIPRMTLTPRSPATKPSASRSPADEAFARFKLLVSESQLLRINDPTMTESDTRSKLIDPVFKSVLGWHETEIRREEPSTKGYADYLLGSDYNYVLVEAKRAAPRFQFSVVDKPRRLKLDGPHLLRHRKLKEVIQQVQGYSSDLGVQFCVATNGPQLIVFRSYVPGRSWKQGTAIVFHDNGDIEHNFAEFYGLLARDNVVAGSLLEAFEYLEHTTTPLYTVLDTLADADKELVRNHVWDKIARTLGPLLTDQSDDLTTQLEVIDNCYVTTPLGDQADEGLDALLHDVPKRDLTRAGFIDLKVGHGGKTAFTNRLTADVQQAKRLAYILTGGVGSGKTTFLRRFAQIIDRSFVDEYTVWLHIDFLPIGVVDVSNLERAIESYVYHQIREQIEARHRGLTSTGEQVRNLFEDEIAAAEKTQLFGVERGTEQWTMGVNAIVHACFNDDEKFVSACFRVLRASGKAIALILDNTDQMGEAFQEAMFLYAQKLSSQHSALCVVTLREEKFFAAYRRGIFDAFGDRHFHIGSPDLRQVLRKRLEYGRTKFAKLAVSDEDGRIDSDDIRRIDGLLRVLIASTTGKNANIVRLLASVSNGDMRLALDMFRGFLASGNTNVDKIIEISERRGGYTVPFHEFAKSAILGSRKFYRAGTSHIVNLFRQTDALGASHLTACRILARLAAAEGVSSAHGQGFVAVPALLREYRESFGVADDLVAWAGELVRRNLTESEPPRMSDIRQADAIRITAAGAYYWRYLARSFAYVDLVYVDTPLADKTAIRHLSQMTDKNDLNLRFERVRTFVDYLARKEADELKIVSERGGSLLEPLMSGIIGQLEAEIKVISKKTKTEDLFGPS